MLRNRRAAGAKVRVRSSPVAALDQHDVGLRVSGRAAPRPPSRFAVGSSRTAVWGQPPVSTPRMRFGRQDRPSRARRQDALVLARRRYSLATDGRAPSRRPRAAAPASPPAPSCPSRRARPRPPSSPAACTLRAREQPRIRPLVPHRRNVLQRVKRPQLRHESSATPRFNLHTGRHNLIRKRRNLWPQPMQRRLHIPMRHPHQPQRRLKNRMHRPQQERPRNVRRIHAQLPANNTERNRIASRRCLAQLLLYPCPFARLPVCPLPCPASPRNRRPVATHASLSSDAAFVANSARSISTTSSTAVATAAA